MKTHNLPILGLMTMWVVSRFKQLQINLLQILLSKSFSVYIHLFWSGVGEILGSEILSQGSYMLLIAEL